MRNAAFLDKIYPLIFILRSLILSVDMKKIWEIFKAGACIIGSEKSKKKFPINQP